MSNINAICVYCGSRPGNDEAYVAAARAFGRILAETRIELIYGGGSVGLMGALAQSVLDHGGAVTGIIPDFLMMQERPKRLAQKLVVTTDMHERKRTMFERADAFVALPGGIGTLEELVEQLTWAQLGRHKKPILLANIDGFWDPLCVLIRHMRDIGFMPATLPVDFLLTEKVEEIVPLIVATAQRIREADTHMTVPAERM